ncbi:MAG: type II secretion system F family protein [Gammaproteobacteria bacterium]|nr:type II secretion system F family protein [Gammaproteobacteria bacterium]
MITFSYEARDKNGKMTKGKLQANDSNQAADFLFKDNLIPININALSEKLTKSTQTFNNPSWFTFARKIRSDELTVFCRQMYSLIRAGVPISSAIQRLADITSNPTLAKALQQVAKEIELGTALSKAMQHHPTVFSRLITSLVTSAEANGRLDDAFLQASKHYELEDTSKKRVKAALRYPIFVCCFAFLAIMVISIFVIPRFAVLYSSFHAALPLPTRILMGFSLFTRTYWWAIIGFILLTIILITYLLKRPGIRFVVDRIQLKLPIFGSILERIVMANFARNLSMLLETGVPLIEALTLVANVVNNTYAEEKILSMRSAIEHGKNLSQAAATVQFFSPLILQMLSVGEETGNMDKMLTEVCNFYEQEVDYDIKNLTSKLEPILLVFVGCIVLLLALGVFLPMWNMVYIVH